MLRVRVIVSAASIAMGAALAGCSGTSLFAMPDWLQFKKSPPPLQTLQFESEPPGADVHTAQGQTCQTPCSLAVPPESQAVTFAMNGYLPQTLQVDVHQPTQHPLFDDAPPTLAPNPVDVALQPTAPPRQPAMKPKPRKTVSSANPQPAPTSSPFPPPPPRQ